MRDSPNLVEVSVIEDEKELGLLDGVDRVRDTFREVPDVAVLELVGLVDAVLVDG